MTKTLLIVEAGLRNFKEGVFQSLRNVPNTRLILATGLSDALPAAWAYPYVDGHFAFSYTESNLLEKTEEYARLNNLRFDGVLTFVEPCVHITNRLQHALGVPHISGFSDKSIRSKSLMRTRLGHLKEVQPRFQIIRDASELTRELLGSLSFPLVIKPSEMMSSLGVRLVRNTEELTTLYSQISNADFAGENLRLLFGDMSNDVLLEEKISGREYSAEVIVHNGQTEILGITQKNALDDIFFDEMGHQFPENTLTAEEHAAVAQMVSETHSALKLQNTITHTEFRISKGKPILMEINCRMAGGNISMLIEKSLEISMGEVLIKTALGQRCPVAKSAKPYSIEFITARGTGRVTSIDPLLSSGVEIKPYVKCGELFEATSLLSTHRLGHCLYEGNYRGLSSSEEIKACIQTEAPAFTLPFPRSTESLYIFRAHASDADLLYEVESSTWETEQAAPKETIFARIQRNPTGTLAAYSSHKSRCEGFLMTVPVSWNPHSKTVKPWSFYSTTENAADANAEYVITETVRPDAPRGTGTLLMKAAIATAQTRGRSFFVYGIRVPNYHKVASHTSIETYVEGLKNGVYHEDIFRIAMVTGGKVSHIVPDYFTDPPSCHYGVVIHHDLSGVRHE